MTDKELYALDLVRYGQAFTYVSVTGTQCPCMVWRESDNPTYSVEWHRLNPTPGDEDCSGSGLISTTTVNNSLKGYIFPAQGLSGKGLLSKELIASIGEIQKEDMILLGATVATTGAFFDMSGAVEREDTVTFNSINYVIRHYFSLATSAEVGQFFLLRRKV
jgi:hypothetical protein